MIICIDIGGETTRVGVSKDAVTFHSIERFETHEDFREEMANIIQVIRTHTQVVNKIVIAAAGAVERKRGEIITWGQKRSWWGQSIFEPLAGEFPSATLLLENDANIAALGEAVFGAGKMYSLVGYLTLSSGIGGGLVHNKTIVPHVFGLEPGHQIVNYSETDTWSCGQQGCYEAYASGTAFKKIFGMSAERCADPAIWKNYSKFVATGLANLLALWSPEIMIIGGGMANKFDLFIGPLQKELARLLPIFRIPIITRAELSEPGLYGGLAYTGSLPVM